MSFQAGDIVEWVGPDIPCAIGSIGIVKSHVIGVSVTWISVTREFRDYCIGRSDSWIENGWVAQVWRKIGHVEVEP